jgi:hypothetical protein
MQALDNGMSHKDARAAILKRMIVRETAKDDSSVPLKVLRVVSFGRSNNLLTEKSKLQIRKIVVQMNPADIDPVLHISNLMMKKKYQAYTKSDAALDQRNDRLEAARVQQLINLTTNARASGIAPAVKTAKTDAKRLLEADVDQVSYMTAAGRLKAQGALAIVGVDVARWGPFDPVKKDKKDKKKKEKTK